MDHAFSSLIDLKASANSFLSNYEPLALVFVPLLSLFIARILRSFLLLIHDNGLKSTILGFLFTSIKMVPGVKGYIDAEKQK
ncbi:hypothetical protein OIU78_009495, partial [Salix suchowensis]